MFTLINPSIIEGHLTNIYIYQRSAKTMTKKLVKVALMNANTLIPLLRDFITLTNTRQTLANNSTARRNRAKRVSFALLFTLILNYVMSLPVTNYSFSSDCNLKNLIRIKETFSNGSWTLNSLSHFQRLMSKRDNTSLDLNSHKYMFNLLFRLTMLNPKHTHPHQLLIVLSFRLLGSYQVPVQ